MNRRTERGVWEEIRKTLAGLFGRVRVFEISIESIRPKASVATVPWKSDSPLAVMEWKNGDVGVRDGQPRHFPIGVHSGLSAAGAVVSHGGEGIGADAATVGISANAALDGSQDVILSNIVPIALRRVPVYQPPLLDALAVTDRALACGAAPPRVWAAGLLDRICASASATLLQRKFVNSSDPVFGFARPKSRNTPLPMVRKLIRKRTEWVYHIPMRRERLPAKVQSACSAERARLAAAAAVPESDVDLLGIYTRVPVTAVSKVALADEGGVLNIWLKSSAAGEHSVRSVTILIGRQRSTGKLIQSIASQKSTAQARERPPQ